MVSSENEFDIRPSAGQRLRERFLRPCCPHFWYAKNADFADNTEKHSFFKGFSVAHRVCRVVRVLKGLSETISEGEVYFVERFSISPRLIASKRGSAVLSLFPSCA